MNIAYVRCSTVEQNEARQLEALRKHQIDKTYIEKASGKNMTERPELLTMLDFMREGDTVYVLDFSRLARSTKDLLSLLDMFKEKKVTLVSVKENLDTSTPTGKLMVTMIAAINEFERENILERQREGIEIAKREGKYAGHYKKIDEDKYNELMNAYSRHEVSKPEIARQLGVSRPTLDRIIEKHKGNILQGTC